MKITVVGAILIVAAVMASVLLLLALIEDRNGLPHQDQSLERGSGAEMAPVGAQ